MGILQNFVGEFQIVSCKVDVRGPHNSKPLELFNALLLGLELATQDPKR